MGGGRCCFFQQKRGRQQRNFRLTQFRLYRGDDPKNVIQNYEIICKNLEISPDSLVFNKQVHHNKIRKITSVLQCMGLDTDRTPVMADGFVTNLKNVTLTCFYADCVPILFYDPIKKVIATAHAGWWGTLLKSGQAAALSMINEYGCAAADILVAIGPCISAQNYEVGTEVEKAFLKAYPSAVSYINDKPHIDLRIANTLTLTEVGVQQNNIVVCPHCTYDDPNYFSHRRMGEKRGSGAAFISLK